MTDGNAPVARGYPVTSDPLRQALDAIQAQCDEMRSLKGWRMNLIRENLAKARACVQSSDGGGETQTRGVMGPQSAPDPDALHSRAGVAPGPSDVMRASDKAAETVASWSPSKQAYAARVMGTGDPAQRQPEPPQAAYVKGVVKQLREPVDSAGCDPLMLEAANVIEALYLAALPAIASSVTSTDRGGK